MKRETAGRNYEDMGQRIFLTSIKLRFVAIFFYAAKIHHTAEKIFELNTCFQFMFTELRKFRETMKCEFHHEELLLLR